MSRGRGAGEIYRIGFTLVGGQAWAGGLNYLYTLLDVITHELADCFSPVLLLAPEEEEIARRKFDAMAGLELVVDPRASNAGGGRRAAFALLAGSDTAFARLATEQRLDLVFETARFFGGRFPIPVLSWIPDFQHRHLPHLFSGFAWWKREAGFRAQCSGSRTVLLSSRTAEADCRRFYPSIGNRTCVASFTATVDIPDIAERAPSVGSGYGLPDRFIFLPNQFWVHKNHRTVIECLRLLKAQGAIERIPPVILTGNTRDPRSPSHFDDCMREVEMHGLGKWFRHLGMIPYADVLALNAASQALLNPSLFEGWSTPIEEAKALGTPLILSDIPTHREQAGQARFFRPDDPQALASILLDVAREHHRPPLDVQGLIAAHRERRAGFVDALRTAFETAIGAGSGG